MFQTLLPLKLISEWKNHFPVMGAKITKFQAASSLEGNSSASLGHSALRLVYLVLFFWPLFSMVRKKRGKVISSCNSVLQKGNIQNSETYTCLCKQGRSYPGQKAHLFPSESKSRSQGREGELKNHSTDKQWLGQNRDKHVDKSRMVKRVTTLAASDMMPQRQPSLWAHSHCGSRFRFIWDGKTGALWTLQDQNSLAYTKKHCS